MDAIRRALQNRTHRTQAQSQAAQALTRGKMGLVDKALKYKSLVQTAGLLLKKEDMAAFLNDTLKFRPNLQVSHLQCHKIIRKDIPTLQQRTVDEYNTLTSELKTYICASPNFTEKYPLIGGQSEPNKRKGFKFEISEFILAIQDLAQTHQFPEQSIEPLIKVATNAHTYQDEGQAFRKLLTESIKLPDLLSESIDDGAGVAPCPTQAAPNLDQFFQALEAPLKRIENLLNVIDIPLQR